MKRIFFSLLLLCCSVVGFCQQSQPVITHKANHFFLDEQVPSGSHIYEAKNFIRIKPGDFFRVNSDVHHYVRLTVKSDLEVPPPVNSDSTVFAPDIDIKTAVGAIPGQFNISSSGSANYAIPLIIPPGTHGMQPQTALSYTSSTANGHLGIGWNITGLSEIRRTHQTVEPDGKVRGIHFDYDDRFSLDGSRLVLINTNGYGYNNSEYRTEIESFRKITAKGTSGNGPASFTVEHPDGLTYFYGDSANTRVTTANGTVYIWLLSKIKDSFGNYMEYSYTMLSSGEYFLSSIQYTGNETAGLLPYNEIRFNYSDRSDKNTSYVSGLKIPLSKIVTSIDILCQQKKVHAYKLDYLTDELYSRLWKITLTDSTGRELSPTLFGWEPSENPAGLYEKFVFQPDPVNISTSSVPIERRDDQENTYYGDFNADGKSDFISVKDTVPDPEFQGFLYIANDSASMFNRVSYAVYHFVKSAPPLLQTTLTDYKGVHGPFDTDGDGFDELYIELNGTVSQGSGFNTKLQKFTYNSTTKGFDLIDQFDFRGQSNPGNVNTSLAGDFDGDGLIDIASLTLFNLQPDHSAAEIAIKLTRGGVATLGPYTLSNIKHIDTGDINGDGITEVWIVDGNGIRFFTVNSSGGSYSFNNSVLGGYGHQFFSHLIFKTGDFNGDGNTDVLAFDNADGWRFFYSNGVNLVQDNSLVPAGISTNPFPESQVIATGTYYIKDFNRDGRSDIFQVLRNQSPNFKLFTSNGFNSSVKYHSQQVNQSILVNPSANQRFNFADIDGDGFIEVCLKVGEANHYMSIRPLAKPTYMTDMADGLNNHCHISYYTLEQLHKMGRYKKATDGPLSFAMAGNFIRNLNKGMKIVGRVEEKQSFGGYPTEISSDYKKVWTMAYEEARFGVNRKKFLGFRKVIKSDNTLGLHEHTVSEFNTAHEIARVKQTKVYAGSALLNKTDFTTQEISPYPGKDVLFLLVSKTVTVDSLNLVTTINSGITDPITGMRTSDTAEVYSGGALFSKQVTSQTYTNKGSYCNCMPEETVITLKKTGKPDFATSVNLERDLAGFVTQKTTDGNKAKAVTYSYTRDGFGNTVFSSGSFGLGIKPTKDSTIYDEKGRFVLRTSNTLNHKNHFTYLPQWGLIKTTTTANGSTLVNDYDGFGQPLAVHSPGGTTVATEKDWAYLEEGWLKTHTYKETVTGDDLPKTASYNDSQGRPVRTVKESFLGEEITQTNRYTERNNLTYVSYPFKGNNASSQIAYGYDFAGRLFLEGNNRNKTYHTYAALKATSFNENSGQVTIAEYDPAGNLIRSTNPDGNEVEYDYSASDQPVGISAPLKPISLSYDESGDLIGKSDPDIGQDSIKINAKGETVYWEDKQGHFSINKYDALGRPDTIEAPEGKTIFVYDNGPNAIGLPTLIKGPGGHEQHLTYDSLQRVSALTELIDGKSYAYAYEYNISGQVTKEVYPGGFEVSYLYDDRGYLKEVKTGEKSLWKCLETDHWENITKSVRGNGYVTTKTFDVDGQPLGIITRHESKNRYLQDWKLVFDPATNNLLSRTRKYGNADFTESFTYDENDRLKNTVYSGLLVIDPIVASYNNAGQMEHKSNAGDYHYDDTRKNAVIAIDSVSPLLQIPAYERIVRYTPFFKVDSVINNGDTLLFGYGYDKERRTSTFKNAAGKLHKVYFGKYETETDQAGNKRELNYIYGPEGIIGVQVKNGNQDSLYYVYTDYLGSWEAVADESDTVRQLMYYDPWGSRTDIIANPIAANAEFIFDRGYTGHEHHDRFGLINMNGRMYDPVVAVMLSPDRVSTDPTRVDDHNLFAYAWYNPLKHTDPTGWNEDWYEYVDAEKVAHIEWVDSHEKTQKIDGHVYVNKGEEYVKELAFGHVFLGFKDGTSVIAGSMPALVVGERTTKPANPSVSDGDQGDVSLMSFVPVVAPAQLASEHLDAALKGENVAANISYAIGHTGLAILDIATFGYASEVKIGQAAVGAVAKKAPTIIGEGMKRVSMEAAKHPGSVIISNMPKFTGTAEQVTSQMMTYNRKWILQQMKSGKPILDIGLDPARGIPSIFYQMEQSMMKNYLKLHPNAFQIMKL